MTFPLSGPLAGSIIATIAIGFLIVAAWMYLRQRAFQRRAQTTVGVVVDVLAKSRTDRDDGREYIYYYPVVSFCTTGGEQIQFESDIGLPAWRSYRKGQQLAILYDPVRPDRVQIKEAEYAWLPIVPAAFGAVLAGMALGLLGESGPLIAGKVRAQWFAPLAGIGLASGVAAYWYFRASARTADALGFVGALWCLGCIYVVLASRFLFGLPTW